MLVNKYFTYFTRAFHGVLMRNLWHIIFNIIYRKAPRVEAGTNYLSFTETAMTVNS